MQGKIQGIATVENSDLVMTLRIKIETDLIIAIESMITIGIMDQGTEAERADNMETNHQTDNTKGSIQICNMEKTGNKFKKEEAPENTTVGSTIKEDFTLQEISKNLQKIKIVGKDRTLMCQRETPKVP